MLKKIVGLILFLWGFTGIALNALPGLYLLSAYPGVPPAEYPSGIPPGSLNYYIFMIQNLGVNVFNATFYVLSPLGNPYSNYPGDFLFNLTTFVLILMAFVGAYLMFFSDGHEVPSIETSRGVD